ncbi:MAG: energy transducer TonB [Proteobacteria bacterium]|nr:energy transducer TonB [Pseudomonadota bacterium]
MKFDSVAALLAVGVSLSGCASVIKGSSQAIAIATPPTTGANCVLTSKEGSWPVVTPGVVKVERSKEDIVIHCTKAGWQDATQTIPSNFEGWTVGNLLIGGVIGVGIDAATGAINEYPHAYNVAMIPAAGNAAAAAEAAGPSQRAQIASNGPPRIDTSGVNQQPNYPATALPAREAGDVLVDVLVRDDGTVKKIGLRKSSGYQDLDDAAVNAVSHWKFIPAMEDGSPASGETVVQISFHPPQ